MQLSTRGGGALPGEAERPAAGPHRHGPARRAAVARRAAAEGEPEGSRAIRERVIAARALQARRLRGRPAACNAHMTPAQLRRLCRLDGAARRALADAHERAGLTMRGHDRVLRVARTLADLDGWDTVQRRHVAQAVAYRSSRPRQRRGGGRGRVSACAACLRRAALLGLLAPWIERALDSGGGFPRCSRSRTRQLIEAVCGDQRARVDRSIEAFDADAAPRACRARGARDRLPARRPLPVRAARRCATRPRRST